MHRTFVALVGAVAMSAAIVSAQDKAAPSSGSKDSASTAGKAVTFVGCLEPGTGDNNYTLVNAEQKGNKDKSQSHVTIKVVPSTEKVKLEEHVTQTVEVSGTFEDSTPPAAGDSTTLAKLPTFSVTKVTYQRDYCG